MKLIRSFLTVVATTGFGLSLHAELVNGIKAVVHDTVVTKHEVESYTAPAEEMLRRQFRTQPDVYERKLVEALNENLEERLKRQLILHDFKSGGYNLPEAIIQDAVEEEIRTRFGGREKLIKSLQSQGMTMVNFRQQTRENIIRRALTSKNISQEIIVSPHRIEVYYLANKDKFKLEDEVKLRMIVLNKPTEADAATVRKLAEEIRTKIKGGAAFSEMAGVYSQGRNPGGDWGWVEKSVLRKELAETAFTLKVGEVSEPVDVGNALYLMLVEDKRPAHTKALGEVRPQVEEILLQEERARLEKQWIDRLKKKTFVRYF
jgi:parvulin-like peptidyl-prolyl isomerase